MIATQDRSGWFGASDTAMIMGNWETKTFKKWWMQKLGLNQSRFKSTAMNAGTYYEHSILDYLEIPRKDHQILIPELHLRINLDGDGPGRVDEIKTHKAEKPFKVSKAYWQQVQVQCFGKLQQEGVLPKAQIHAYGLTKAEYKNFFLDIDPDRLTHHPIKYDEDFIGKYLARLLILGRHLEAGTMPRVEDICKSLSVQTISKRWVTL